MSDSADQVITNGDGDPISQPDEPNKSKGKKILLGIVILIAVIAGCSFATSMWCGPSEEEKAEDRRRGKHCLDSYTLTSANRELIKERLAYPDSFVEMGQVITPVRAEGYHYLTVEFHSKNAFGMESYHEATFNVPHDGCTDGETELILIE